MLTTEQKLLCGLSHLGTFVGLPIVVPLIVLLISGDEFVKQQAKEALAFQVTLVISGFIGAILTIVLIGFLIFPILGIVGVVLPIIAVIKIVEGEDYSYPLTGSFVRS